MSKTALTILAITSTLVLGGMGRANAATITATYDFTASGFPSGSPVSTWDGSFTITFNPTLSGPVGPLALDAFSSNLPASYGTFEYGQFNGILDVGDNCFMGGCEVNTFLDQAFLGFSSDPSGVLTFNGPFSVIISSANTAFHPTSMSVTMVPTPATPLPAGLPLFATGLGALGLLGWYRKRKASVSMLGAA